MKVTLYRKAQPVTVTIDDADWWLVREHSWHITASGYACTNLKVEGKYVSCMMHRMILGLATTKGWDVDHINRDRCDNRKANLRVCTHLENAQNRSLHRSNKTGVRGVQLRKNGRFEVRIMAQGKRVHLGMRDTLEAAEELRLAGEARYYGAFAPGRGA